MKTTKGVGDEHTVMVSWFINGGVDSYFADLCFRMKEKKGLINGFILLLSRKSGIT